MTEPLGIVPIDRHDVRFHRKTEGGFWMEILDLGYAEDVRDRQSLSVERRTYVETIENARRATVEYFTPEPFIPT